MTRMSLSGIRYIYEARLGASAVLVQEGFAILGIAVGVALLFASQVSSTSLTHSEAQLNTQLVGNAQVQLDARGPEGFSEQLLAQVQGVPGVQVALADSRAAGERDRAARRTVGRSDRGRPAAGARGGPCCGASRARQLASLRGDRAAGTARRAKSARGPLAPVKLQIGAQRRRNAGRRHAREARHRRAGPQPDRRGPDRVRTAPGRRTRAGSPGSSCATTRPARAKCVRRSRDSPRRWNVNFVPGQFDSRLFAVAVAPESKSEALFSAISALVGFMFALNAMLITVPARRKLIEDILPHGATRWMTIQILLFDAAVHRRAGLRPRAGARGRPLDRRLSQHTRLSRVCVSRREQPDRDLAERRAGHRGRDGGGGHRGALAASVRSLPARCSTAQHSAIAGAAGRGAARRRRACASA